ncbi:MAG: LCP family protein [Mycobacteriales bacterium]
MTDDRFDDGFQDGTDQPVDRPGPDSPLPRELDPRRGRRPRSTEPGSGRHLLARGPAMRALLITGKTVGILASIAVLVASGMLWGLYHTFKSSAHQLPAGAVPTVVSAPPSSGNGNGNGSEEGPSRAASGDPDGKDQNILLVGSGSRVGLTNKQLAQIATDNTEGGYATDSILLVHIPADGREATVVSFPRDGYVQIPNPDPSKADYKPGKINGAYADGACYGTSHYCNGELSDAQQVAGTRTLIATVDKLSGLHVDHYVQVGLYGFYQISEALGGVDVCLLHAEKDPYSGIDLSAGHHKLEGTQALAFVRQRHGVPGGDIGRIKRQQAFLGSVARQVLSAGTLLNPIKLARLVRAIGGALTYDGGPHGLDPIQLASQLRDIAAGNVHFETVPISNATATAPSGESVVQLDMSALPGFFDKVIGKTSPATPGAPGSAGSSKASGSTVPRAHVSVRVLNGDGVALLATHTAAKLRSLGFSIAETGDANPQTATEIHYGSGQTAQARTLAAAVPGSTLVADDRVSARSVTLVLGSGFDPATVGQSPRRRPGTPSSSPASGSSGGTTSGVQSTAADRSCVN